jgi:dethiobiotin synthetase
MAELVAALGLPVLLVVGLRLGCLNHALLTAESVARAGCRLASWVGNVVDPHMAAREENLATLRERLPAPCLGIVPRLGETTPAAVAARLDAGEIARLLAA